MSLTRELRIDGTTGTMAIVNYANRTNAFNSPLNNLPDVYFHTGLKYLQLVSVLPVTVNLAQITGSQYCYSTGGCC